MLAVRCDGQGDVSKTHLAWKLDTGAPKTTSPVLVDNLLYMVADDGGAQCLEAATGNVVWKGRIPGNFSASLNPNSSPAHNPTATASVASISSSGPQSFWW